MTKLKTQGTRTKKGSEAWFIYFDLVILDQDRSFITSGGSVSG